MATRRRWIGGAAGAVLAGAVGIGLVVAPGAAAQPELPSVSAEDLVASVITAQPGPFAGTVEVDSALGLPAVPGVDGLGDGTTTARVWSGGDGLGRVSLPRPEGETTLVSDGSTRWRYDSTDRTATRSPARPDRGPGTGAPGTGGPDLRTDPAGAARALVGELRETSGVAVDGTAEVAGRPAFELVLTPAPTERTLLREVRVAVDAQTRLPLELAVLAQGSPDPALRVAFTDLELGPQDPALFTFTPPPGTTVEDGSGRGPDDRPGAGPTGPGEATPGAPGGPGRPDGAAPRVVGDGWDRVVVATRPDRATGQSPTEDPRPEGAPDLSQLGTPVSGPWGSGRLISTAVASAIVTDDGRIAAGAVPEPVLAEALTR